MMVRKVAAEAALKAVEATIPALSHVFHKGQHGRVAVMGGCLEYCGAPFYAALTALKTGADISHIFCTKEAGIPIKSFSPELIVHPVLEERSGDLWTADDVAVVAKSVEVVLPRIHSLVVGPGLGRNPFVLECAKHVITAAMELNLPIVIDADGLFALCQDPTLVQGYTQAILTPNAVEFQRLCRAVGMDPKGTSDGVSGAAALATKLGHVTIVQKGKLDVISDGHHEVVTAPSGCLRRCGGQGDVLAGSLSVFQCWASTASSREPTTKADSAGATAAANSADGGSGAGGGAGAGASAGDASSQTPVSPMVLAGYGAAILTRTAATRAFGDMKRALTTPDIIKAVGASFEAVFPTVSKL